jgi:hypothetical protein
MEFSEVEWATLDQCVNELEKNWPPAKRIASRTRRELVERIARGEIGVRFGEDTWSRDDLLVTVTREYLNEDYIDAQIANAQKRGDTAVEKRWTAQKKKLPRHPPDYSLITIDSLPAHIVAELELRTRDVLSQDSANTMRQRAEPEEVLAFLISCADGTKREMDCLAEAKRHFALRSIPEKNVWRVAWGSLPAHKKLQRGGKVSV